MKRLLAILIPLLLVTPVFAQIPGLGELERFGFPDILLWLLTFAIVFGILSQIGEGMPKSKNARVIISLVVAFMVLLAAPESLIAVISQISSNLVLVAVGILVLVAFLEIAGLKTKGKMIGVDKETGKRIYEHEEAVSYLEHHGRLTALFLIMIVVLIFIGAGGLNLIGLSNLPPINLTGLTFFVVIIMAVMWMIAESGKK